MRRRIPGGAIQLVAHQILELHNGKVAVLARGSTAWCILSSEDFNSLKSQLGTITTDALDDDALGVIGQLWDAGMLQIGGRQNPATVNTREEYPSSLLLKLTGACNIECTYCYDYDASRFKKKLPLSRITGYISLLLKKRSTLSILFHGGEPLLQFPVIKEVVAFALRESGSRERLHFGVQTNGTLFTEENVAFFRKHNFSVGLSLDSESADGNRLRVKRSGDNIIDDVKSVMRRFPGFLQERAGVLSVVSKSSLPHLPAFMRWLQENGISGFSVSFLDLVGRGSNLAEEKPTPQDAVSFYSQAVDMIRRKEIVKLNFKTINSHISNFFTFQPRDFCHKGPCGAAGEFLVLDAEGNTRTCDCIYDPYFLIQKTPLEGLEASVRGVNEREKIVDRHVWLEKDGPACSNCALFGVCGGTCVAKAIAVNGDPLSVNPVECAVSKYIYPLLLEELSVGRGDMLDYYYSHRHV